MTPSSDSSKRDRRAAEEVASARGPLAPLVNLQRLVSVGLDDLRSIAQVARLVPEITAHLEKISRQTDTLNREVRTMRKAVEDMRGGVEPLDGRLRDVHDSFERLEVELTQMGLVMHPLRRARAVLGGGRHARPEESEPEAREGDGDEPEAAEAPDGPAPGVG